MECFEPSTMYYSLHQSVYGIRIIIRNTSEKKILCVNGLMKDIPLQYLLNNDYINTRIQEITLFLTENNIDDQEIIERWIDTITIKDILIYSNNDLKKKYNTMKSDVDYVKNTKVENIVKKFFDMDLTSRRKMLINLFTYNVDNEVQYIAYMLYDLIGSSETIDGTDNPEQVLIYESLPWKLKQFFKETMINTIEYTTRKFIKL